MVKKYLLSMILLTGCLWKGLVYADSIYNYPVTDLNQPDFKQVQTELSTTPAISGDFTQRRDMSILAQPLLSSGHFTLSASKGLLWQQTQPFALTLQVTANKIAQTLLNNPPMVLTRKEQPLVFTFTSVFLAVFQGDIRQIQQYFTIYFRGNAEQWQLALKPKAGPLDKGLVSIELSGGRYISTITINEVQHNKMTIHLTDIKPQSESR